MLLDLWSFFQGPLVPQGQPRARILQRVLATVRRAQPTVEVPIAVHVRTVFLRTADIVCASSGLDLVVRSSFRPAPLAIFLAEPVAAMIGAVHTTAVLIRRDERLEIQRARRLERLFVDIGDL